MDSSSNGRQLGQDGWQLDIGLEEVAAEAGAIAEQRPRGDLSEVPPKVCLFHAHVGNPSRRADDQDGSSRPRAVRNQLPQLAVLGELRHVVPVETQHQQRSELRRTS